MRRFQEGPNDGMDEGDTGVIIDPRNNVLVLDKNGRRSEGHDDDNLELISSNKNNAMNLIEKAKLAIKGEPEDGYEKFIVAMKTLSGKLEATERLGFYAPTDKGFQYLQDLWVMKIKQLKARAH